MDIFANIARKIIKEQELIIGPLAWDEARKVGGLSVGDVRVGEISISGDAKEVLNKLVSQYERLFGRASQEVCREAVLGLISDLKTEEIPASLR